MAVVKVIGEIDGKPVVFERVGNSSDWAITIPQDLDGEYVVSVVAYDEAGNVSYATQVLFTVRPEEMYFELKPLNFNFDKIEELGFIKKADGKGNLKKAPNYSYGVDST